MFCRYNKKRLHITLTNVFKSAKLLSFIYSVIYIIIIYHYYYLYVFNPLNSLSFNYSARQVFSLYVFNNLTILLFMYSIIQLIYFSGILSVLLWMLFCYSGIRRPRKINFREKCKRKVNSWSLLVILNECQFQQRQEDCLFRGRECTAPA